MITFLVLGVVFALGTAFRDEFVQVIENRIEREQA